MKLVLTTALGLFAHHSFCEIQKGFDKQELREMIALCNSYTFLDIFGDDSPIIPAGYEKLYTSETFDLDNKFQIYKKGNQAVINLRGSTDKKPSWLENFYASMIPTRGVVEIKGAKYPYDLGLKDENAAIHGGYVLGITYLIDDIKEQIHSLNAEGIYSIYLTGHSQGGALAQVLKIYLESIQGYEISDKNRFKTYAFASPKLGNRAFSEAYTGKYADGSSFSIINPKDVVPTMPLTYSDSAFFTKNDLMRMLFNRDEYSFKERIGDGTVRVFTTPLKKSTHIVSSRSLEQINKGYSDVVMPKEVDDINYCAVSNHIKIPPAEYPKNLGDSTLLDDAYFMSIAEVDEDGNLTDPALYNKEPFFYQHKPYNYYVTILKVYFPEDYEKLTLKYIPANI